MWNPWANRLGLAFRRAEAVVLARCALVQCSCSRGARRGSADQGGAFFVRRVRDLYFGFLRAGVDPAVLGPCRGVAGERGESVK